MNLWNFVSGYVKIRIMGEYPERLVNRAAAGGIPVSCAKQSGRGCVCCRIPAGALKRLRHYARGSGCRVHIVSKHGLPYARIKMRRRAALCLMSALAALTLCFASTRVLALDIHSGRIDAGIVRSALEQAGVRVGMASSSVSPAGISKLLDSLPGVSKSEVRLKGVILRVILSEAQSGYIEGEADPSTQGQLTGIYASKDCVITEIYPTRGRALVKAGDAVAAGTLLITGDMGELKEGYFVEAEGLVYGRVLYRVTACQHRQTVKLCRTGAYSKLNTVSLFGREFMFSPPYERYELEPYAKAYLSACPFPVSVKSCLCFELAPMTVEISESEAMRLAEEAAKRQLLAAIPKDARLVSIDTEFIKNEDGSCSAAVTAVSIESIGYTRRIYD